MPLGHLGVNVSDLPTARAYYDELLPMLGFEPFVAGPAEFSYRPAGGKIGTVLFFYQALEATDYSRHRVGLQHLAFMVKTPAEVDAIHDWARARGAEIIEPPQEFPQYHPGYYAAFFHGPDGFMLEVVCHKG
ncbi:VOC family protein [Nocardia sp. XZ_19_385]|uniref:VOC family protein n=1 Tax=Nocardia sp. XZ_19_385 TaxID=2769488 RepID=UPI0018900EC9|nr:VOC family protein [Nocardia sp. XZ_19_385]